MEEYRVYKAVGVRRKVFGEYLRKCEAAERAALSMDSDLQIQIYPYMMKE